MSSGGQAGGAGAAVRQGHLRKLKTMKKKYFVLRAETAECSARLEYYESEKKFRSGAAPRRVLPLKSCYNIMRRLDLKQKHVIALFTREEQFCVVAENEQDLHAWLTAILKQHRNDDASEELLHPIQHVWQVNVQKKGLGATKNIQGLYNLCLTDKTLSLVKIKSQNNVISDLGIPERIEYSLKNIRRCGDSECFFYMEVGRQTATGAGELWMHTDDSNIAQSMHSTIYHAMRNCAKESENERDHIIVPKPEGSALPARSHSVSEGKRPALANDASTLRSRCDSMPSGASSSFELDRPPPRYTDMEGMESSRDEADTVEWHRTPRIPEEPDFCDPAARDLILSSIRGSSVHHSRTSSIGLEELEPPPVPDGYLPMAPGHDLLGGLISASSGSVCSGTPSTDPRFSEYQLEPATSHIVDAERPPRAYSVGSRPAPRADAPRHRAYSVGAPRRPALAPHAPHACHAAHPPRADDLMELDFSTNSPTAKMMVARTPPADEYVDMSPRARAGYVEMRPGESAPPPGRSPPPRAAPDGYVEMSCGRVATRPIAIATPRVPPAPAASPAWPASPDERQRRAAADRLSTQSRTPLGSQTIFPLSLDSPASPAEPAGPAAADDDAPHHPLTTVREISEECGRRSPELASSPSYVKLAYDPDAPGKLPPLPLAASALRPDVLEKGEAGAAPLHYAALDLEPRCAAAAPRAATYTQIDFARCEKLHVADD